MQWILIGLIAVIVVALLIVPMFTNKKRAKQEMEIHNSLRPGDVIKTLGGVVGTIKAINQISPNEREMVLETGDGDNKSTITFDIRAFYMIISRADVPEEETNEVSDGEESPVDDAAAVVAAAEETVEEKVAVAEEEPVAEELAVEEKVEEPAAEEKAEEPAAEEPKAEEEHAVYKPAGAKKKSGGKNSAKK